MTDRWLSGGCTACSTALSERVTEKKAGDRWPGEETSSQGRSMLLSGFMLSRAVSGLSLVSGSWWLVVRLWSVESPWHQDGGGQPGAWPRFWGDGWSGECALPFLRAEGNVPADGQTFG